MEKNKLKIGKEESEAIKNVTMSDLMVKLLKRFLSDRKNNKK